MDRQTFCELHTGDLVVGRVTGEVYVVMSNYGNRATAVRTIDMTNPNDWELVNKANYKKG
jgi:hypothetical protein